VTSRSLDHAGENLLRELAPQVLGAVVRRFGDFSAAEDAVQEALLAAAVQWPQEGVPHNPRGWLIQVAARRMTDHLRTEFARRRREAVVVMQTPEYQVTQEEPPSLAFPRSSSFPEAGVGVEMEQDDTLIVLFMCCHPALTRPSAIALTLRAVGGLTTAEIAHAFMVPESTMAQRISRAKHSIRTSGVPFRMPITEEWTERLSAVLHVLYLIFNEGYATSAGPNLLRTDLSAEALRLGRMLHRSLPDNTEVAGLLALMLLTDARRPARVDADGELIPLAEQDRTKWDRESIREGIALISDALPRGSVGPYQLQAAIAAVHDEAVRPHETDWPQILALYTLLERMSDNPMVTLNRAIAMAMVHGPAAGLQRLDALEAGGRLGGHHRVYAVRGHLLEMAGDRQGALASYRAAAARTASIPEQRYLLARAARITDE
jgi:RNA polymerase sigma factor (sigma-70 family)